MSSNRGNVSLKNCTAAEGSSYEFIFDQVVELSLKEKQFHQIVQFFCILYIYGRGICLINSELCMLNRQVRIIWDE